jgi:Zn finger protein HypA/HybF involved in hydrogenase expression
LNIIDRKIKILNELKTTKNNDMKNCPNCNTEIEDGFEVCWNCCYSLTEKRILEPEETGAGKKDLKCLRCNVNMFYSGNYKFHEGSRIGILGNFFEWFVNRESFDIYVCPKCGKVEFFVPEE